MTCTAHHRHRGVPCAPSVCRAALLAMCATRVEDRGEKQPMPDDSAGMVWTVGGYRFARAMGVL